jgi:hypothetical protein
MPTVLPGHPCPDCDQLHAFCLPDESAFRPTGRYRFVCPTSNRVAVMRPKLAYGTESSVPDGAVLLTPVLDDAAP